MAYNPQLLDGIVVFTEVVKHGSFTLAAQHTGHSTSYISKEINKLEARLGVRLMNRTTRSLRLTTEGELYFQQCELIIGEANQTELALSGQQLDPVGTLRISCPIGLGVSKMQTIFTDFMALYPQVDLELDLSNRKVDMIAEGFDVIVRATEHLEDSSLICKRILQSRGITLASPSYLKKFGTPEIPEDLKDHKCITYSHLKQPKVWEYKNQYGKRIQVDIKSRVLTNSSELKLAFCKSGQGITQLPLFALQDELASGELVELFCDYQPKNIDVFLIYPSRRHMSSKVRSFIDFVSEAFETEF